MSVVVMYGAVISFSFIVAAQHCFHNVSTLRRDSLFCVFSTTLHKQNKRLCLVLIVPTFVTFLVIKFFYRYGPFRAILLISTHQNPTVNN